MLHTPRGFMSRLYNSFDRNFPQYLSKSVRGRYCTDIQKTERAVYTLQRAPHYIPARLPTPGNPKASSPRRSAVPSERIAPSSGHLRRSGGQSAQGTHQTRQRLPECGLASLVRRLADVSQIVAGIPIVVASGAIFISTAYASSVAGSGTDAGSGLLQDATAMLLAAAIDAPSGRRDTAAAVAVSMTVPLFFVEMLLQLHVAQSPIHQPD